MSAEPSYLYRAMPDASKQGPITRSGRGWYLRDIGGNPDEQVIATVVAMADSLAGGTTQRLPL